MSIEAVDYVFQNSKVTGNARLLMVAIASHATAKGYAYPGRERLTKYVRVHSRRITELIKQCEWAGELAVIERPGKSSEYYILGLSGTVEKARPHAKKPKARKLPLKGKETPATRSTPVTSDTPATGSNITPATGDNTPLLPVAHEPSSKGHLNQKEKDNTPKPPKPKKPASSLSEAGKASNALIAAWKTESNSMRGNPYANKTYRECADNMTAAGITPEQVTAYVRHETGPGMYWHGKAIPFTNVAEHIVAWLKTRKPAPIPFSPENDPQANLHTPQGDDEEMTPEQRKEILANIRKIHAEMASRTFEQQIEYWQQNHKPGA